MLFEPHYQPHYPRLPQAMSRSEGGSLLDPPRLGPCLRQLGFVPVRRRRDVRALTHPLDASVARSGPLGLPRHRHGDGRPFRDTKSPPTIVNSTTSTEEA